MVNLFPELVSFVARSESFQRRLNSNLPFEHVCQGAQSFLAACLVNQYASRSCWIVCPDVRRQEEIFNGLMNWQVDAIFLPELELPVSESAVADPEIVAERLAALRRIAENKRAVLVLTARSLDDLVAAPGNLQKQVQVFRRADFLERDTFVEQLVKAGYEHISQVTTRGQIAVRGGIIDVFSWQHTLPIRLELFGDQIESIREFDLDEQTSIQALDRVEILVGEPEDEPVRLRDYFGRGEILISIDSALAEAQLQIMAGAACADAVEDFETAFFETSFHDFEAGDFLVEEAKRETALEQLRGWIQESWRLCAVCHNEGEVERLKDILKDNEVDIEAIQFAVGSLVRGFVYPAIRLAILSDAEIFGRYKAPSARRLALRRSRLRGSPIDFAELVEGDLVVHLEHGIGRYRGLQCLNGTEQVVMLEFADEAKLYVPFEQAFLISRYVGIGRRFPPLSVLGDSRWSKAKKAAETAVFDYAAKLLSLQAERNTRTGFAFPSDTRWQHEFESSFLYEETIDQLRAIEETKTDMESLKPMDRLICGDVGFGKTEVALRAAFKTVMSGKQVVMLVPTTVLAQQHYHTFKARMSDYPVQVAMLSRFLSQREQSKAIKGLRDGSIDIVIGTHRVISPDIEFKQLGLVVVDEEQRFGVKHKERFKEQFKLIDVLTLSATPIPRTLYLSLVGAKDMSVIETPPPNRLPVETVICAYDERIIRDAIARELQRNGQVYFLHNRVHSIERVQERIKMLCPEARVGIGHGQMEEDQLE
ncbi:MAG: DEAD/DEAH box helicase, partial [Verrucomicrobia bacterium]|nr:DEAD/DEAH box helicase [Verrucomicrobiota bacterium]